MYCSTRGRESKLKLCVALYLVLDYGGHLNVKFTDKTRVLHVAELMSFVSAAVGLVIFGHTEPRLRTCFSPGCWIAMTDLHAILVYLLYFTI